MPTIAEKLRPELQNDVKGKIVEKRQKSKYYFDKKTRKLPELEIGNDVYVNLRPDEGNMWRKAKVADKKSTRKYIVDVNGSKYVRNRQFIRLDPEATLAQPRVSVDQREAVLIENENVLNRRANVSCQPSEESGTEVVQQQGASSSQQQQRASVSPCLEHTLSSVRS